MENYLQEQEIIAQFFRSLEEELELFKKSQRNAGWAQRNAVIEHVYSDYQKQVLVLTKKENWEKITFQCNVLKGILDLLLPHRDIYGLYDLNGIKMELEGLIKLAEEKDEFEIAALIYQYRIRFVNAF